MIACRVCRTENRDDARFCNNCGTRLSAPTAVAEERKVITALFCDLVGFTATSEGADPEDVDRMLSRYAAMARAQIESHGGVVEKFIGDAVVGIFGVPQAHEDDPERAVRAALGIAAETERLLALRGAALRLRVGINTGEAFVRLEVGPQTGDRFLAGDTINTASRIQSVAPEMGVAVGLATYEATKRRFEYEELPPATLKGKSQPVRVFHPIALLARLRTDGTTAPTTRFVGRVPELAALAQHLDDTIATTSLRVAMIVGEPGLGKSRLVAELLARARAEPILVTWREGRCLPYGAGVSFWALGEIVKGQAGILESDSAAVAEEKLDRSIPGVPEHTWLRDRLLPLIGIDSGSSAEREEQFSAWSRFLELLAQDRPAVVVFEDLHWADDAMLSFLDHLVARAPAVPLLVVETTRPDLFDRRPTLPGGGSATELRIDLAPLPPEDASELATSLFDATPLAPELAAPLLDRAGGNPLFVEEFVRLLVDRDLLVRTDAGLALREGAALPVPESIHAVLAARLDALPGEWKQILADASVVGNVFWDGAVAAIGKRDGTLVSEALAGLARREFVRRSERSSMAGEVEYAFWHALARDVAYGALPRTARAAKHTEAAGWIEAKAADRLEDVAEVLAHHYSTALELARAPDHAEEAGALADATFRFLTLAGERAMGLDMAAAVTFLSRAVELAPAGDPRRLDALVPYGRALSLAGRFTEAIDVLQEAIDGYLAADRLFDAGSAMLAISDARVFLGRPGLTREVIALVEPLGPSMPLVTALVRETSNDIMLGEFAQCLERVDRILELTTVLEGRPGVRAADIVRARTAAKAAQGDARLGFGDFDGAAQMEAAATEYADRGDAMRASVEFINLSDWLSAMKGPAAGSETARRALDLARPRGLRFIAIEAEIQLAQYQVDAGDFREALAAVESLESGAEEMGARMLDVRSIRARVATMIGQPMTPDEAAWLEALGVETRGNQAFGTAALARHSLGDVATATSHMETLSGLGWETNGFWAPRVLPALARLAMAVDRADLLEALTTRDDAIHPLARHAASVRSAALLESSADPAGALDQYAAAGAGYGAMGIRPEEAFAQLGRGRCLASLERTSEAKAILRRARATFVALGMDPGLSEVDRLLASIGSARPG